jgi:hypothetical protein
LNLFVGRPGFPAFVMQSWYGTWPDEIPRMGDRKGEEEAKRQKRLKEKRMMRNHHSNPEGVEDF